MLSRKEGTEVGVRGARWVSTTLTAREAPQQCHGDVSGVVHLATKTVPPVRKQLVPCVGHRQGYDRDNSMRQPCGCARTCKQGCVCTGRYLRTVLGLYVARVVQGAPRQLGQGPWPRHVRPLLHHTETVLLRVGLHKEQWGRGRGHTNAVDGGWLSSIMIQDMWMGLKSKLTVSQM